MQGQPGFNQEPKQEGKATPNRWTNIEIREILSGLVGAGDEIQPEDYEHIRTRASKISEKHKDIDEEDSLRLAYMDVALSSAKQMEVPYEDAIRNPDMVKPFIEDPALAQNDEFIKTVINKAEDIYTSGKMDLYSDALFAAIEERQKEFKGQTHIEGVVDESNLNVSVGRPKLEDLEEREKPE